MKKLVINLVFLLAMAVLGTGSAFADQIPFTGAVSFTQSGNSGTPALNLNFLGLQVSGSGVVGADTIANANVGLGGTFTFNSIIGNLGFFSPSTGTITVNAGNANGAGSLSATVQFVNIVSSAPGNFTIIVGLNGISATAGTSALINQFTTASGGQGQLQFGFSAAGSTAGLSDLLYMNTGTGSLGGTQLPNTSVQGTIAVPEPASLALLGSGLVFGSGFARRKLLR